MPYIAWQTTAQQENGDRVISPTVTVRDVNGDIASIYSNSTGTAKSNPFSGTSEGFVQFYAEPGRYTITATSGGDTTPTWTVDIADAYDVTFASRAEAEAATVLAPLIRIAVLDAGGQTLRYVYDADATALTTGDGRTWAPDGDVYVEHYGATGDGATFDDVTITAALEAGHAVVHTRPGRTYLVSTVIIADTIAPLTFRHDGTIKGDGTNVAWSGSGVISLRTASDVRDRIIVEGTGVIDASDRTHSPGVASGSGMAIRYSDDAIVRGIKFVGGTVGDGFADSGVVLEYCQRALFEGCTFDGFDDHDIYATGAAFPVTDATRGEVLTVTNCFFMNNGAGSLRCAREYRYINLTNCHFYNCYRMIVGAGGSSNFVSASVFTITGNIGRNFRQAGIDLRYSHAEAGSIIANNQIYDYGVLFSGSGINLRGTSQVIVTGNIIKPYLVDEADSVSGNNCIFITAATGDDGDAYAAANVQIFGNTLEVYDRSTACCIVDATNAAYIYDNMILNTYPRDIRVNAPGDTDEVSTRSPRVRRVTTDGAGFGGTIPRRALQSMGFRVSRDPYISAGNVDQDLPDTQYLDFVTDSGGHNFVGRSSPTGAKKVRIVSSTNTDNDTPSGGANGIELVIRDTAGLELQDDRSVFLVSHAVEPPIAANNSIAISDGTSSTNGFGTAGAGLYEKLSGAWTKIGVRSAGQWTVPQGTAAAPGLAMFGDTDSGFYRAGANDIRLALGGADAGMYRRGNIRGTVSQSAGVPTGDLMETGTNANGTYMRFADGTQICFITDHGSLASSTASGNIFTSSAEASWTFPSAFFSSASVVVYANALVDGRWASARRTSSTGANFRHWSGNSSVTGQGTSLVAIGRWF